MPVPRWSAWAFGVAIAGVAMLAAAMALLAPVPRRRRLEDAPADAVFAGAAEEELRGMEARLEHVREVQREIDAVVDEEDPGARTDRITRMFQ